MLMLGLAGRNSGTRPSDLIGVRSGPVALDFDLAVSLRLANYDNERSRGNFRMLSLLITGKDFGADDDTGDAPNVERW